MKSIRRLVGRYLSRRQSRKKLIRTIKGNKKQRRKEMVFLWYYGVLQQLKEWGIIDYDDCLSGVGHEYFYDLININFKPTDEEIELMVYYNETNKQFYRPVINLVKDFRDNPKKIKQYCIDNKYGCYKDIRKE